MKCPDCNGSGSIQLFTSAKPCATCGGTGVVFPLDGKNDSFIAQMNAEGKGHEFVSGKYIILDMKDVWTAQIADEAVDADRTYTPTFSISMGSWQQQLERVMQRCYAIQKLYLEKFPPADSGASEPRQ